jgi:hypothetical protein
VTQATSVSTKSQVSISPQLTSGRSQIPGFFMTAGDAAVVYDLPNSTMNPAYSGSTLDGTGVTIGAIELSNVATDSLQDFVQYRTTFLNNTSTQATAYIPTIVVEGNDPGVVSDSASSPIADGEISQAIAPGSHTILYVASTMAQALVRAVDDNKVSILLNGAVQDCESNLGPATNAFLYDEYEQAAAQGITVIAAAGDFGSTGCKTKTSTTATGFGVNGGASTPWNLAVGGTEFQVLETNPSQYITMGTSGQVSVGSSPYYITALSYIPEAVQNGTTWAGMTTYDNNSLAKGLTNEGASGGGASSKAVCSGTITGQVGDSSSTCSGSLSGYTKPSWQTSLTPSDGVRDVPDIALFSGNGFPYYNSTGTTYVSAQAAWALCIDSNVSASWPNCTASAPGQNVAGTGGTTAAAAAAAGIFALVEQAQGQRLGLVNPTLYRLASVEPSVFHDVSAGNNSVPCTASSANCGSNGFLSGYNAVAGYDMASGFGSLDVAKLISNWSNAGLDQTSVSLSAGLTSSAMGTSAVSVPHGTTVYFNAAVNPTTATGSVALVNTSGVQSAASLPLATLANGIANFSSLSLPGGTYTVQASYGGDSNDAAAQSNSISITVSPEASTLGMALRSYDPSTGTVTNNVTSVPYGMELALTVTPYGSAGSGKGTTPTGTISAASGQNSFGSTQLLTVASDAGGPGTGYLGYFNSAVLTPGADTIAVTYSGDSSYTATTSNLGITVTKAPVTVTAGIGSQNCTTLKSDWSVKPTCTASANVNTNSVGNVPSGNITIAFNGVSQSVALSAGSGLGTSTGVNVVNSIGQTSAIDVTNYVGTYLPTTTATYGGDSNYQGGNGASSVNIAVSEPTGASFALSNSGSVTMSTGAQGSSTITITPASGFLGPVTLTCTVNGTGTNKPTCTIPATAVVSGSSAQTVTLSLNATSTTASSKTALAGGGVGFFGVGGLLLCGLLIWKRRIAMGMIAIFLVGIILMPVSGCSKGGSSSSGGSSGTTKGTYTVTIQGSNSNVTYNSGWVSSPITASTTVTVTVN